MQPGDGVGIGGLEPAPQDGSEQMVVPVFGPGGVEGDEEEVRAIDLGEHRGGVGALEHGVAEGRRQSLEHRRVRHEVSDFRICRSQDIARRGSRRRCACHPRTPGRNARGSTCSLRTIAARQSPASQPSVRSVSPVDVAGGSRTFTSRKSASASVDEMLRSRALSSVSSPWARSRAIGRRGSWRLEITTWTAPGARSTNTPTVSAQAPLAAACQSSSTRTTGGQSESSSTRSGRPVSTIPLGPAASAMSERWPAGRGPPGAPRSRGPTTAPGRSPSDRARPRRRRRDRHPRPPTGRGASSSRTRPERRRA